MDAKGLLTPLTHISLMTRDGGRLPTSTLALVCLLWRRVFSVLAHFLMASFAASAVEL